MDDKEERALDALVVAAFTQELPCDKDIFDLSKPAPEISQEEKDVLDRMRKKLKDPHKTVHPFSCGYEYSAWKMRNCNRECLHYADAPSREACEIEYELGIAFMSHGRITPEIMDRMGDGGKCSEYEAI